MQDSTHPRYQPTIDQLAQAFPKLSPQSVHELELFMNLRANINHPDSKHREIAGAITVIDMLYRLIEVQNQRESEDPTKVQL